MVIFDVLELILSLYSILYVLISKYINLISMLIYLFLIDVS